MTAQTTTADAAREGVIELPIGYDRSMTIRALHLLTLHCAGWVLFVLAMIDSTITAAVIAGVFTSGNTMLTLYMTRGHDRRRRRRRKRTTRRKD